ncbi:Ionotropic glutamate receptor L-glutamate and glycine-binding domain [Trinorchestia longiramus]|nr:Ionotropic glutamate receptor L-glutamate and glycine-binding domain [Trinorchestia longiramus]
MLIPIACSLILLGLISYIVYSGLLVCYSNTSHQKQPSFVADYFYSQRNTNSGMLNSVQSSLVQTSNYRHIFDANRPQASRNISTASRNYRNYNNSRHPKKRLHSRTCWNDNSSSSDFSSDDYWNSRLLGRPSKIRRYSAITEDADAVLRYSLEKELMLLTSVENRSLNSMTQLGRVSSQLSFLNYFVSEDKFIDVEQPSRSGNTRRFWQSRSLLSAEERMPKSTPFAKSKTTKITQNDLGDTDYEHQTFKCVFITKDMDHGQNWPEKSLSKEEWLPAVSLITKLLHDLNISEVHLCSAARRSRLHVLLSLLLPRAQLYTGACSSTQLLHRAAQLQDTAHSTSTGATHAYRYRSAVLYLVDEGQEVGLLQQLISHDTITKGSFYAIVVSSSPKSCFESPSLRTTHWMHVTFSNARAKEEVLHVHESYSFLGAAQPIVAYLGAVRYRHQPEDDSDTKIPGEKKLMSKGNHSRRRWTIYGRGLHNVDVQLHRKPRQGPSNFQNYFINVIVLMVPPFIMRLPSHCLRGKAAVELAHNVGLLGPDDDYCPLAHHAWRRLYLMNHSSPGAPPLAPQEPLYGGYLVDILMTLAHKLNFSYHFVYSVMLRLPPPDDAYFGLDHGNGSFTGLVGALQRREVDLSLGPFTMTRERLRFIDFSVAVDRTSASLFINQNAVVSAIGWGTYILSFHWTAWVALLLLLITCSIVLVVMVRHDPKEDQYFGSASNVIFIFFSCLVQQGRVSLDCYLVKQA